MTEEDDLKKWQVIYLYSRGEEGPILEKGGGQRFEMNWAAHPYAYERRRGSQMIAEEQTQTAHWKKYISITKRERNDVQGCTSTVASKPQTPTALETVKRPVTTRTSHNQYG